MLVYHLAISQTVAPLAMLLVPLESPHWVGLHQVGFIMLQPMVDILNQIIFHWRFIYQNKTFRGEFGCVFGTVGNTSWEALMKVVWKFLDLILSFEYFFHWKFLNYKMILNGKISWVINSHMATLVFFIKETMKKSKTKSLWKLAFHDDKVYLTSSSFKFKRLKKYAKVRCGNWTWNFQFIIFIYGGR